MSETKEFTPRNILDVIQEVWDVAEDPDFKDDLYRLMEVIPPYVAPEDPRMKNYWALLSMLVVGYIGNGPIDENEEWQIRIQEIVSTKTREEIRESLVEDDVVVMGAQEAALGIFEKYVNKL